MKISFIKYPFDIIICITWSIVLLPVLLFTQEGLLRIVLSFPFLFFIPGYLIISALFPIKKDETKIKLKERLILSVCLSIAVVSLIGFILNFTRLALALESILSVIFVLVISVGVIAIFKWNKITPDERYTFSLHISLLVSENIFDRILTILIILSLILAGGFAVNIVINPQKESFTEFYLQGSTGETEDYSTNLTMGLNSSIVLEIFNHEYTPIPNFFNFKYEPKPTTYTIDIWLINQTIRNDSDIVNWSWDFGDKSPIQYGKSVTHYYSKFGSYLLTLTVKDIYNKTVSVIQKIAIGSNIAKFLYEPSNPSVGDPIQFNLTSIIYNDHIINNWSYIRSNIDWYWSFGDGTYKNNKNYPNINVTHRYSESGFYLVNLTIQIKDNKSIPVEQITVEQIIYIGNESLVPKQPLVPIISYEYTSFKPQKIKFKRYTNNPLINIILNRYYHLPEFNQLINRLIKTVRFDSSIIKNMITQNMWFLKQINTTANPSIIDISQTLTLTTSGTGTGTLQASKPGPYKRGDIITIWANASTGSTFTGFTGSLAGSAPKQILTFYQNEVVDAAFTWNGPYTLTLTKSGTGLGTIETNTTGPFHYGDTVKIWANASNRSIFTGFTGSLTGTTTPQILTFDGNETVDAAFTYNGPYTLTLTKSGTGSGRENAESFLRKLALIAVPWIQKQFRVRFDLPSIETNTTGPFYYGDTVKIWAYNSRRYTFTGFTGSLTGTTTPQILTFDGNETVDAAFTQYGLYTLTLTKSGTGLGTIETNTTGPFYYGDTVKIWANTSNESTFTGFTGDLTGTATPQILTVNGNEVIDAAFTWKGPYTLTLTKSGTGSGTIETNTTGPFYYGDTVKIWANTSNGSTFTGFTGSLTGTTTPQILTFDGNETIDATFTKGPYFLTHTTSGTGYGTVQVSPAGPYYYGSTVTIWANASTGSTFTGFTGDLTGTTNPQTLIITGNKAVDVQFTHENNYFNFIMNRTGKFKLIFLLNKTNERSMNYWDDYKNYNIAFENTTMDYLDKYNNQPNIFGDAYRELHLWIDIFDRRPTANFTFDLNQPSTADTITFTDNSITPYSKIKKWTWNFGDGTNTSGEIIGLQFDGIRSYVDCGTNENLQPISGTIEAWIYINNYWGVHRIFTGSYWGNERRHPSFFISENKLVLTLTNNHASESHVYDAGFQTNTWYHIAATWHNNTYYKSTQYYVNGDLKTKYKHINISRVSFYVNGVPKQTDITIRNWKIAGNPDEKRIGALEPPYNPEVFHGIMKDFKIYNRSLTSTEIWANYNGNITKDSLVSWWKMTDGGNIAYDSSSNGNNDGIIHEADWLNQVTHQYSQPGDYTVTLTVINDYGQKNSTSKNITIN